MKLSHNSHNVKSLERGVLAESKADGSESRASYIVLAAKCVVLAESKKVCMHARANGNKVQGGCFGQARLGCTSTYDT